MKKILVLEGGYNEEHQISLNTGKEIKKSLLNLKIKFDSIIVDPKNFSKIINNYSNNYLCFNALHGTFGEDGTIQKILESKKFKYTHSNIPASNIAFNKNLTKEKIKNTKILTAKSFIQDIKKINESKMFEIFERFQSFVIKPVSSGSSYGIKIIKSLEEVKNFVKNINFYLDIYKKHNELLIEKYIEGRELTVAVIDRENVSEALEVTEIFAKNSFFDYQSKYEKGFSKHVLPAELPSNIYQTCLEYAKIAHDKINCRGISRSDFLYDNENVYFLEINSQPGLTPVSLVPEQFKYRNIDFDTFIQNLINLSL